MSKWIGAGIAWSSTTVYAMLARRPLMDNGRWEHKWPSRRALRRHRQHERASAHQAQRQQRLPEAFQPLIVRFHLFYASCLSYQSAFRETTFSPLCTCRTRLFIGTRYGISDGGLVSANRAIRAPALSSSPPRQRSTFHPWTGDPSTSFAFQAKK
jgi:hypothetical protein